MNRLQKQWWPWLYVASGALAAIPACSTGDATRLDPRAAPDADVEMTGASAVTTPDTAVESAPMDAPLTSNPRTALTCPLEPCFGSSALLAFDSQDSHGQRRVVRGTTAGAPSVRSLGECASAGPDLMYALDLRQFEPNVMVYLEARAEFDVSVAIEEGPFDDPFVVKCNEDHDPDVENAFLAVELAAKQYRIVVSGEEPEDAGEFELVVEVPAEIGRCATVPSNDRCEAAVPMDPDVAVQTFVGTTHCSTDQAQPLWECGDFENREGEVFYSLDLSKRTERVLLHADTGLPPTNHETGLLIASDDAGTCSTTITCNNDEYAEERQRTQLWALLDPGRYFLGVQRGSIPGEFGLRVELGGSCAVPNDTCRTATPLAAQVGQQSLVVWPMCGDDSIASSCESQSPTPDIFYRLDLREFAGRVRVRAVAEREFGSFDSLVLLEDAGGDCGKELWCGDFDLWLEPRSYLIALDGFRDQQGPVTLDVEISADGAPQAVDCIDLAVAQCAAAADPSCCAGDGEFCAVALAGCGLSEDKLRCVCDTEPACCGPGWSGECGQIFSDCRALCPDFNPASYCAD